MKLSFGVLEFEEGDVLHVEDTFGKETFYVSKGHDCSVCEFSAICNERNPENKIAKHCRNTHFSANKK